MSCCGLDDGCAAALATLLEKNTSLTSISLRTNSVGDETMTALSEALESNKDTKLATLNLGVNRIGTEGGLALAKMLKTNTSLTDINLSFNNLGEKFGAVLAHSLEEGLNKTLAKISLRYNGLGENGVEWLTDMQAAGKTGLTEFDSYHNTAHYPTKVLLLLLL